MRYLMGANRKHPDTLVGESPEQDLHETSGELFMKSMISRRGLADLLEKLAEQIRSGNMEKININWSGGERVQIDYGSGTGYIEIDLSEFAVEFLEG